MKQTNFLLTSSSKLYIPMAGVLAVCFAAMGGKANVLWGVPFPQGEAELLIRPFLRWQLLTLPPLLFASEYLCSAKTMAVFIRIRIKNDLKFTVLQIVPCITVSALWGTLTALTALAINPVESAIEAFFLTVMGHILRMDFYLLLYFATNSVSASVIAEILSTASIFCIGELLNSKWEFWPTSWGMVSRSSICSEHGIQAGFALKCSLLVFCCSILIIYLVNRQRRKKQ